MFSKQIFGSHVGLAVGVLGAVFNSGSVFGACIAYSILQTVWKDTMGGIYLIDMKLNGIIYCVSFS